MHAPNAVPSKTLAHIQAHIPIPKDLESYRDVLSFYDNRYHALIEAGDAHPFLYPWATLGAALVLLSLTIDYRRSRARRLGSYLAFGGLCCFQTWTLLTNKARNPAAAFGVGILSSFGVLWTAAIMVFNDCQRDWRRVERIGDGRFSKKGGGNEGNGHPSGVSLNGSHEMNGGDVDATLRQRQSVKTTIDSATKGPTQRHGPLTWQSYPTGPFIERLDWIADAFCSFRGVGWTWQSSGIPPAPSWVQSQLSGDLSALERDDEPVRISKTGIRRFSDRQALLKTCLKNLAVGYILLDAIKTLGIHDRYMWYGDMSLPLPDFLPEVMHSSFVLTKSYRLLVCLSAINIALWAIFKMGPVFFVGVLGPRIVGLRGEAWMNPADMFGDFNHVLDSGLAGWWGAWWHQTFRVTFQQPGDWLVASLGLKPRSIGAKLVSTWVAFFLSGVLHATGSHTQLGDTYPLTGPMMFFMMQALGVTVQTTLVQLLKSAGVTQRVPKTIRRISNLVITLVWMFFTAPLLVDDFARGGIWLFEPVPISIFRGLGLGPKGAGWWCWYGFVEWRSGESWWDSGIAL
jgi:hypothetical protein